MPSTYTVNLGIEKPATGEQSGTWGDTTNTNFDILDQGINGAVRVTLSSAGSSGSPNALQITNGAASDGRNKWIEFYSSGDLGGSAYVQLDPNDAEKIVFVRNSLASSRSVILFQGTYNAARDLEVPAGVDMVVKFDGGGASAATVTDVYTNLRVTALTTPSLTATTADINGGTVDNAVIGGSTPAALTATTIVANTSLNIAGDGATVTGIKDEDNMSSNSATKLATQQSIKAYVDSQVGTVDTLAEILANGNTSGSNNLIINNGQALTSNTINETTAGSGVTIDSVLLKDDVVNATDVETGSISANDGTAAATIANSTGNFTITNFISNSVDIGGGAIDGTVIGGASAAAGSFTTIGATGAVTGASSFSTAAGGTFTTASGNDLNIVYPDSRSLFFKEGSTTTLTLDNAQGATFGGNVTMQADDALLFIKETDGTNIAAVGDLTGSGQGGAFYYNHGGTAVIQLKSYEASQINSGIVFNEDSADVDFRVEGNNNANMIFVDGANDYVSIATTDDYGKNLNVSGGLEVRGTGDSIELQQSSAGSATYYAMDNTVETGGKRYRFGYSGGTADKGSFSFYNQTDDLLNLVLSDDANVFNEDSKDVDFRVESNDNTHALFVDGGNNRVGVFTSSPAAPLDIQFGDNANILRGSYASAEDNFFLELDSKIVSGGVVGYQFHLTNSGTAYDNTLTLDRGNVGIGVEAADEILHVEKSSGTTLIKTEVAANSTVGFEITKTGTTTQNWRIADGQVANGSLDIYDVTNNRSILHADSQEAVINDTSADLNFRIESDANANMLFVDAEYGHVNIGTATDLGRALNVQGNLMVIPDSGVAEIEVSTNGGGTTAQLKLHESSAGGSQEYGATVAYDGNANLFKIGVGQDTSTERMRIERDTGNVIFNDNSNDSDFRVESDGNTHMLFVDAGNNRVGVGTSSPDFIFQTSAANAQIGIESTTGGQNASLYYTANGANQWEVGVNITSGLSYEIYDRVNNGSYLTVDHSGNVKVKVGALQLNDVAQSIDFIQSGAINFDSNADQTGRVLTIGSNRANGVSGGTTNVTFDETGGTTFNEGGVNADFRVESDENANMLTVDAGANSVRIATANTGTAASLEIQNLDNKSAVSQISATNISGSSQYARYAEGVEAYNTTSSGTILTIPITDQSNLHRQYIVDFMFCSAEYNSHSSAKAGTLKIGFTSLNTGPAAIAVLEKTGNVASVSGNDSNLLITFTSGYTIGLSDYEGVICHYKVLGYSPEYLQMWNGTLN